MAFAFVWKLALTIGLAGAIILSAAVRAPRKPLPRAELRWLVAGTLALDAVALLALVKHRPEAAVLLFAGGAATSTLAAWLSRGSEAGGEPPRGEDPVDEPPPELPDGSPSLDWPQFERDLADYAARSRELVGSR